MVNINTVPFLSQLSDPLKVWGQLLFHSVLCAHKQSEFYRDRYEKLFGDRLHNFRNTGYKELFNQLPPVTKDEVSIEYGQTIIPYCLLDHPEDVGMEFFTGGSSKSRPIPITYSRIDWHKSVAIHAEVFKKRFKPQKGAISFNFYNRAHISASIFDESLRACGIRTFHRSPHSSLVETYEDMRSMKAKYLIAPPSSYHKGGCLMDILDHDSKQAIPYIHEKNVKGIIVSSSVLSKEIAEELNDRGISNIINCFGSTEVMPIGFSEPSNPRRIQLLDHGWARLELVDEFNQICETPGKGRITLSRFAPITKAFSSSIFLKYISEDYAYLERETCHHTGRILRYISDIQKEPYQNGCQVW